MTLTEFLKARCDEDERRALLPYADHPDFDPEWKR